MLIGWGAAFQHFLEVLGELAGRLLGGAIALCRDHLVEQGWPEPLRNFRGHTLQQREGSLLPCQSLRGGQELVHRAVELSASALQFLLVVVGHAVHRIDEGAWGKAPEGLRSDERFGRAGVHSLFRSACAFRIRDELLLLDAFLTYGLRMSQGPAVREKLPQVR